VRRSAEEEWVADENGEEWEEWLLTPQDEVYFVCTFIDACTKWLGTDDYVHPLCGLHPSKYRMTFILKVLTVKAIEENSDEFAT